MRENYIIEFNVSDCVEWGKAAIALRDQGLIDNETKYIGTAVTYHYWQFGRFGYDSKLETLYAEYKHIFFENLSLAEVKQGMEKLERLRLTIKDIDGNYIPVKLTKASERVID